MRTIQSTLVVAFVVLTGCHLVGPRAPVAGPIVAEGPFVPEPPDTAGGPAEMAFGSFALPVTIHGRTYRFLADHGSTASLLTDSAAARIGMRNRLAAATRADTLVKRGGVMPRADSTANEVIIRGDSIFEYWGDLGSLMPIDSLRLGVAVEKQFGISDEEPVASLVPFDGLFGRDLLSHYDLLFDQPRGVARLYRRSADSTLHLPPGMTPSDCVRAGAIPHMGVDTTGMDDDDRRQVATDPIKRFWEQEELRLPIEINGRPIDALFDSGSGATVINWAEAALLGVTRDSPAVRPYMAGGLTLFISHKIGPDSVAPYRDSTFRVSGLEVRIAGRAMPLDTLFISDPTMADFDSVRVKPMAMVGLRLLRDHALFLSYSSRRVCLSARGR